MGAPKKNQYWKMRSKHGRDKIFKTPQDLEECANEYFKWCDTNPLYKAERNGSKIVDMPLKRPYTLEGFCIFAHVHTDFWRDLRSRMKNDKDFSPIIKQIEQTIYNQKFEGAATGLFNANFIARDLKLKDYSDVTTDETPINKELTDKELNERLTTLIAKANTKGKGGTNLSVRRKGKARGKK